MRVDLGRLKGLAPAIVTVGTLTAALWAWLIMAQGELGLWPALSAILLWSLLCTFGSCCASLLIVEETGPIDPVLSTVLGFYACSVFLFFGTVIARMGVLVSLGLFTALTLVLVYLTRRRRATRPLKLTLTSWLALALVVVFATCWSRQSLAGLTITEKDVTSVPWLDAFYHSVYISHFAHAVGKGMWRDPLLATNPLPFYHYAAYLVPSAFVRFSGVSSYIGTVALFTPVGQLLTGLGAYLLGMTLVGPLGGLCAAALSLAIPDPSMYFVQYRWLSYFFFQQIAANGAMGTALMLTAWTLCIQGVRNQQRRYTFVALAAAVSVAFFKSQIFIAYSFGWLLFASLTFPRSSRWVKVGLGALAVAAFAVCAVKILPSIPRAPTLSFSDTGGPSNLMTALDRCRDCRKCVEQLTGNYVRFVPVGVVAFLALEFCALVPLWFCLVSSHAARTTLGAAGMAFLWIVVVNYLVVTLGLATNAGGHGDEYEVIHKTFVWPYLAISAWCGCALAAWAMARTDVTRWLLMFGALPLVLYWLGGNVWDSAGRLQTEAMFGNYTNVKIDRGAYDVAEYIRHNTPRTAIIQPGIVEGDLKLMFNGLMDRDTYVGYKKHGRIATEPTDLAYKDVRALMAAGTVDELRALGREHRLFYLVLYPGQKAAWEAELEPVFRSGEYRVFWF